MVIDQNNSYLNSFTKGMNSDTTFDQIDNSQYIFGKNIRITKNQNIGEGQNDSYSTLHEGVITPVPKGLQIDTIENFVGDILAVNSIDNICVIVAQNNYDLWVYRCYINEITNDVEDFGCIWRAKNILQKGDAVSTVVYKELDNVVKLYIATGEKPIITIRIDESTPIIENDDVYKDVDAYINNRIVPTHRVKIAEKISGRLKTSQVQYTYRFYNKHGVTTQLAPLTNKIQVINSSRSKEIGNAEDTETSIGFRITINTEEAIDRYNRIQIYRLSYIKPGDPAEVSLIYDDKINPSTTIPFELNDVGIEPLQVLTMEEFAAMSGVILIPQVIEQNQEYMFCGNVQDDTIIKGFSVTKDEKNYDLIQANVSIATDINGVIPDPGKAKYGNDGYNYFTDLNGNELQDITINDYFRQRGIDVESINANYNDIFTSSLLRSLRRGDEIYKYGIVFYDKYGRRTDVIKLCDVETPKISESPTFSIDEESTTVNAKPIGIKVNIPKINYSDKESIIGCQIIRRSSSDVYQKTLLQVALARPIQQGLLQVDDVDSDEISENLKPSPFYPTGFLAVNDFLIKPTYYTNYFFHQSGISNADELLEVPEELYARTINNQLFQIFSSEIDLYRNDILQRLTTPDATITEQYYLVGSYTKNGDASQDNSFGQEALTYTISSDILPVQIVINRLKLEKLDQNSKNQNHWIFNFFNTSEQDSGFNDHENVVNSVKDVKMADWESGFTNVTLTNDGEISDAIKKYKSYTTNIDKYVYNNWVSFGKYDFWPGVNSVRLNDWTNSVDDTEKGAATAEMIATQTSFWEYINKDTSTKIAAVRNGYIGPGGSCMLLTTEEPTGGFKMYDKAFYTSVCNIQHTPKLENVESDESVLYYGFGNYFTLNYDKDSDTYKTEDGHDYFIVFDGDIYITPHELTTEYKTYNFQSYDTLQSTQITNYVPLESKVNTFFDYGMNLMNTQSANLLYEPGSIDGITSQDRPVHQYNMIYSENDTSNDVFTLITTDESDTNNFKQRVYYSEPKENGEYIDNFVIFKPASFIDVDSKYGQITNLFTDKNILYYWQDHAFGKFSVNERSLINDQNGNTIMLGQAGILSRFDYISTKYGMRLYDFCATSAEQGVYWVDVNNKAIVAGTPNQAVNYGEQLNVQNIINGKIDTYRPKVDYDLQNNELLCKCFTNAEQMVFNVKYNMPTSIYTRSYSDIANIKNHIYGLLANRDELTIKKYNYLETANDYLSPLKLDFVVNHSASTTKVFDNQQLVPIKRDGYLQLLDDVKFSFETDIVDKTESKIKPYNDREGNITYAIPRYNDSKYGSRIRGKWLRVNMEKENPDKYFTISHIITKFRQSFS